MLGGPAGNPSFLQKVPADITCHSWWPWPSFACRPFYPTSMWFYPHNRCQFCPARLSSLRRSVPTLSNLWIGKTNQSPKVIIWRMFSFSCRPPNPVSPKAVSQEGARGKGARSDFPLVGSWLLWRDCHFTEEGFCGLWILNGSSHGHVTEA